MTTKNENHFDVCWRYPELELCDEYKTNILVTISAATVPAKPRFCTSSFGYLYYASGIEVRL